MPDSVKKHVERAEQFLSDASAALEEGRLFTAVDRSYYSMFHGAHAILISHGFRPPKTHNGLLHLFSHNIERAGLVKKGLSRMLSRALDARQEGTCAVDTEFTQQQVKDLRSQAEEFLEEIKASLSSSKK